MNIGFFDSGLGGLLILKATARALPQYDYIYYADTAHLPFGDKTEEEIFEYTKNAIEELFKQECLLVVVACNTSSAESLRKIQDTYLREHYPDRRILGVIVPTIEEVAAVQPKRALLLATKRTVESGKYARELEKVSNDIKLISVAAPELVPLIELHEIEAATQAAIKTIEAVVGEGDVVILGCTHYVMLKNPLREHFGNTLTIISQDEVIPKKLEDYLSRHEEIAFKLSNTGKRAIQLTEHRSDYGRLTAEFLGGVYIPEE